MGITYFNSNPVPVEYTEEEMREKILVYIKDTEREFSFKSLSVFLVHEAIKELKRI